MTYVAGSTAKDDADPMQLIPQAAADDVGGQLESRERSLTVSYVNDEEMDMRARQEEIRQEEIIDDEHVQELGPANRDDEDIAINTTTTPSSQSTSALADRKAVEQSTASPQTDPALDSRTPKPARSWGPRLSSAARKGATRALPISIHFPGRGAKRKVDSFLAALESVAQSAAEDTHSVVEHEDERAVALKRLKQAQEDKRRESGSQAAEQRTEMSSSPMPGPSTLVVTNDDERSQHHRVQFQEQRDQGHGGTSDGHANDRHGQRAVSSISPEHRRPSHQQSETRTLDEVDELDEDQGDSDKAIQILLRPQMRDKGKGRAMDLGQEPEEEEEENENTIGPEAQSEATLGTRETSQMRAMQPDPIISSSGQVSIAGPSNTHTSEGNRTSGVRDGLANNHEHTSSPRINDRRSTVEFVSPKHLQQKRSQRRHRAKDPGGRLPRCRHGARYANKVKDFSSKKAGLMVDECAE